VARRVSDGTRTRGHLDHNQVLYQLSYTHRARELRERARRVRRSRSIPVAASAGDEAIA
jgi:hypothetical protein